MSSCPACSTHVSAAAKFCRMCGHPLAVTSVSAPSSDVSGTDELIARDAAYEDSVTLSFVSDSPAGLLDAGSAGGELTSSPMFATDASVGPVCEICGHKAGEGKALCKACAQLTASGERDDG